MNYRNEISLVAGANRLFPDPLDVGALLDERLQVGLANRLRRQPRLESEKMNFLNGESSEILNRKSKDSN